MRIYLLVAAISAVVTFGLALIVYKLSHRFRLYPKIRERDVHTRPTPRLGGVAMFIGMVVAFAVASQVDGFRLVFVNPGPVFAILGAALIIVVIGVIDDLIDLDWTIKLAGQIIAAWLLVWQGVAIVSLPIAGTLAVGSGVMSLIISLFAVVLVMNAINFIDGLDGLVAGVCLIANGVFFLYTFLLIQEGSATDYFNLAALISAILIGACAGFLPLNWHPAKLFMGDAGAMLVGLLMATSAIAVTGVIDPATLGRRELLPAFIPILLPFAILVLPLLDFGLAVFRRLRAGKSPFSADRKHLHHRLLDMGHSHFHAVLIFYAWTAVVSVGCLLFFLVPTGYAVVFLLVGLVVCTVLTLAPLSRRKVVEATAQSTEVESPEASMAASLDPLDAASESVSPPPKRKAPSVSTPTPRATPAASGSSARPVFVRILKWGGLLALAIAVIGGVVGFLVDSERGLVSALVGTAMAILFTGLTAASILVANRFSGTDFFTAIFFAVVMGAWIVKFAIFLVLVFLLRDQPWINPVVMFLCIIAGVLGSLIVDVVVVATSRMSYASDVTLPGE